MDCPVCFESCEDLVAGPCGHGICLDCSDQLLLKAHRRQHVRTSQEEILPTLGKCPLCREDLLRFDLKFLSSQKVAFPGDPIDEKMLNSVYVGQMGVGWASLHFFEDSDIDTSYILCPDDRLILEKPRYHRLSQTCAFSLNKSGHEGGMVLVSFSDNFSVISRGLIRITLNIRPSKIDGIWKRPGLGPDILVFNRQCAMTEAGEHFAHLRCEGEMLYLLVSESASGSGNEETWIGQIEHTSSSDDEALPNGARLQWKKPDCDAVVQEWVLDRTQEPLPNVKTIRISGDTGQSYWRLGAPETPLPVYNESSLMGNVFVQQGKIGVASYHFDTTQPYISYEHLHAAVHWPPLDDGRPIPSRMYFSDTEIVGTVFRGTIDWIGTYGTTWNDAERWVYEIRFDDRFQCAVGGTVQYFESNQVEQTISGSSKFGEDLLYYNAAMLSDEAARTRVDVRRLSDQGASRELLTLLFMRVTGSEIKQPSFFS